MRIAFIAAAAAAGLGLGNAGAQEVRLKLGHINPTTSGIHQDFILPWTEAVTECSNGEIQFEIHGAGTQLGSPATMEEFLRAGLIDVGHGLNHFPRGRFTPTTVIDTPLLARSAYANSNTLWSLYEEGHIDGNYEGLHLLALHAHNAGLLHTRGDNPVRVPADMEGLRVRTPAPSVALMVESLGGVPVGVPPGETYDVLSKGTADGTVFPWEAVYGFKLAEVLDHHSELGLYTTSFWFAMNENSYERLTDAQKACVDEASGRELVKRFGGYWDQWDVAGREIASQEGNETIEITAEERAQWEEALRPVVEAYHASLEEQGVENVGEAYARAQELMEQYQAEYEAGG